MRFQLIPLLSLLAALASPAPAETSATYFRHDLPVEERVDSLMAELTLEEKVHLCHGNFVSGGIPRLGIGPLKMLDGRQGLRPVDELKGTKTTLLPCALALSCTWNEDAAKRFGKVLAEEMLAIDHHVLLAPMLNLVRSPLGGRNFENFGEDPLLVGRIGAAYITGVQEQGVGACACLLVANDCEHRRHYTSSNMDQRTLRELHLVGYEMASRNANVWTMMTGNNLLNGVYCAQNPDLLQGLMKDEIGFDGVMITDWRAAYETTPTALAGTDMATGFCSYVFGGGRLLAAVKSGQVPPALLDDKVRRVLRLYVRSGVLNPETRLKGGLDTPEHRAAARQLAAEGMVLLKNDAGLLPLDSTTRTRILLTGPVADRIVQGGGSGNVPAAVQISPLDGLKAAMPEAEITHIPFHAPLRPKMDKKAMEWDESPDTSTSGTGGAKPTESAKLLDAARQADTVIFVAAGTPASEGRDLPNMALPGDQAKAIAALAGVNQRVIVVLVNNGAVRLNPWQSKVPAIMAIHYSGQATGHALADVLTGKVNPSAKLSYTFARNLNDYPVHAVGEWPAKLILDKDPGNPGFTPEERKPTHAYSTEYKEGLLAGYRWFDAKNIEPRYPFGFGLSFTTFEMSDLKVAGGERVECTVKNTGTRAGAEVVQVYVAPPASAAGRAPRELKGFARVMLQPGESQRVEVQLDDRAFAHFDEKSGKWKTDPGSYQIQVGNSSRHLPLKATVTR